MKLLRVAKKKEKLTWWMTDQQDESEGTAVGRRNCLISSELHWAPHGVH
jgi:hypothetical protein